MTQEEKQKRFEEQQFKKKWAKRLKLSPMPNKISANVGRAPRCNSSTTKKEVSLAVASKKKK